MGDLALVQACGVLPVVGRQCLPTLQAGRPAWWEVAAFGTLLMLLVASVLSRVLLRLNGLKVGLRHSARGVILAIQHVQITELGAV